MGYNIKTVLIVVAPSAKNPSESKILLVDGQLPSSQDYTSHKKINSLAYFLLKEYTGLTNNWINLIQAPVIDILETDNTLIIPFGCMVPEEINLSKNAVWYNIRALFNEGKNKSELEAITNV